MATFTNLMQLTELGEDRFEAPIAPETSDRMFGGQFLAQCLRAAQATRASARASSAARMAPMRPSIMSDGATKS